MEHGNDNSGADGVHANVLGVELWDTITRLSTEWMVAASAQDHSRCRATEQDLRFFLLSYVSLSPGVEGVSTGRKAILRALYDRLGDAGTGHVSAILQCVIEREESQARQRQARGKID